MEAPTTPNAKCGKVEVLEAKPVLGVCVLTWTIREAPGVWNNSSY